MSEEKLLNVINNLSKLKDILVSSKQIKKCLRELEKKEDKSDLDGVIRDTRELVDNVYDHVNDIKKNFYKDFCEGKETQKNGLESSLAEATNCDSSELEIVCASKVAQKETSTKESKSKNLDETADKSEKNLSDEPTSTSNPLDDVEESNSPQINTEDKSDESNSKTDKPVIKLVDINKLVDPSRDPTISNNSPEVCNSSVIILTSSDEESSKKQSKLKGKAQKKDTVIKKASEKKKVGDSSSDESEKIKTSRSRRKNTVLKRTSNRLRSQIVEITSSDSEDSAIQNKATKDKTDRPVNGQENSDSSSEDESTTNKPKWLNKLNDNLKSSSDDDSDNVENKTNKQSKRKTQNGSHSSSSDEAKKQRNKKRRLYHLDQITLSDSSDTENENIEDTDTNEKKKKSSSAPKTNTPKKQTNKECLSELYIPLPRIPTEKLQDTYLKNKELLEIKRLTNMKTLKSKRSHTDKEESKSSKPERSCPKSKKKKPVEDSDKESDKVSDSELKTVEDVPIEEVDETVNASSDVEDMAEALANNIESTEEEVMRVSDDDKPESDKEGKKKDDKIDQEEIQSEEQKDKQEKVKETTDLSDNEVKEKEKESSKNKEKSKWKKDKLLTSKLSSSESDGEEKDKQGRSENSKETAKVANNDSVEKQNKEKEAPEKSKSKKDVISSSDSEVEQKKKEKRSEKSESASDEELKKTKKKKDKSDSSDFEIDKPSTKPKSKRKIKKRAKVVIDSDDSDNNEKSSGDEFQAKENSESSESEKEKEKEEEPEPSKSKRKRIRKTKDSSSDDEDKSTRKQIRKVISRDDLSDTTKKAEADEKERKARILEKQKKYNLIFESTDLNATVEKVVLDFNEDTKEELLILDKKLTKKLKPHQASGIKFMWDACYESLERAKKTKGSGCILAHCMGLGKTLQVIALTHALLTNSENTGVERVMVVCPVNTVLNWKSEFKKWLPNGDDDFEVYELVSCKQNYERQYQISEWYRSGGVLIIGYNMFRTISNPNNKKLNKKMRKTFHEGLVDPGPDLVVCDEGHLLKNEKSGLNIAMNRIKTLRRIVLTGTPLQNNLKEYWCMVQFVKPNLLGTYKEYLNRFVNPITNGQYTDSTPHDIQIMRKRAHVLHKMLDGVVQRKDYAVLQPYLPPKHEYVLFVNLSEVQIKIYEHYMANFARKNDTSNRTSFLFTDFQQLQRICTHPRVLLDKSIEDREKKDKLDDDEESEGSLKDFIDDGSDRESGSTKSSSSDNSGNSSDSDSGPAKKRTTRAARAQRRENNEPDSDIEEVQEKEWWQQFCDGEELDNLNNSGKLFLLFEILKECEQIGDKILIFSQSLYTLNCIEYFLNKIDEATQSGNTDAVGGHCGSWAIGLDYFRLDGSSSCDNRATWCDSFNNPSNTRARLFLISTKAGGLGINLTAANRVIIFDVSWNPSHDTQSIYRVYRFGQTKPSYVYRFVAYGTMEMKVYERQVTKQAISKRVIDEQQIDRHYNQNDLQELYRCDLRPAERPIPLVPKDVLLGEMLQTYDKHIYKYHEHQSLLENKEEETLNEEERKAAWEEFENEKTNRYNYNAGQSGYSTKTIALALTNIVKKDNPTWTDIQIKGIIPALVQQLQVQMQGGDLSMYLRVQEEIKLMQQQQAQKFREQYYQAQVMRMIQQQQQQASLMGNLSINPAQLYNLLGGSGASHNSSSSNDIIELN